MNESNNNWWKMRQLKFRAWDKDFERFRDEMDYVIAPDTGLAHWIHDCEYFQEIAENLILQQFTGLYDCNGKEIWEGDILEYKRYYANIRWWSTVSEIPEIEKATERQRQDFYIEKGIIRFNDGAFCLDYKPLSFFNIRNNVVTDKLVKGQNYNSDYEEKWWDFKVIGNIYLNDTTSNNQ